MAENINNEVLENGMEYEAEQPKVLIALTKKRGGSKILVPSMEGYTTGYNIDGIGISFGENAALVSLTETQASFGGESEDLPADSKLRKATSPSMTDFDGEQRTEYIISRYKFQTGAAIEAKKAGWLPSGGEMALIHQVKDEVNTLLEAVGGTPLSDEEYWTSQMFNNEYPWFLDMSDGTFAMWKGQVNVLKVRPVKALEGYEEVVTEE